MVAQQLAITFVRADFVCSEKKQKQKQKKTSVNTDLQAGGETLTACFDICQREPPGPAETGLPGNTVNWYGSG